MCWWTTVVLAGIFAAVGSAELDSAALLARVRSKVQDSAKTMPRYVCRQKLERQTLGPIGKPPRSCGMLPPVESPDPTDLDAIIRLTSPKPKFFLRSSDRASLDVMLAQGTELYSWPGGGKFQTNNPNDMLGGGFGGNGDFAGFVITAFGTGKATFNFLGECDRPSCVRYSYDVPVTVSHYVVKTPLGAASFGYHGTLEIDPASADLLAATVIPTGLSQGLSDACDMRTHMTYTSDSRFTIPESVVKEYLQSDGWYFSNWLLYTGCRQYTSESSVTFGEDASLPKPALQGDPQAALPRPGTTLQLRLASTIDSKVSSAGDAIEATLVRAVHATDNRLIPAGTLVRGHLAEVERVFQPRPARTIAMRFDTIVLGEASLPLTLAPAAKMDARGRAVFTFKDPNVVLDRNFISRWIVR